MVDVRRTTQQFDLDRLVADVERARAISDFEHGPYGAGISLPAEWQVPSDYRRHRNNVPFTDALTSCDYFREIFESFHTDKVTFRLLRRSAHSAYAFHDDRDKGSDIVRLQIPIVTNDRSFLVIPWDGMSYDFIEEEVARHEGQDIWFDLERLDQATAGMFDLYQLAPGALYYFDTNEIHTLINAAGEDRVVLSIDLIMNDWVRDWLRSQFTVRLPAAETARSAEHRWKWNSLRNGVIRNPVPT